MSNEGQWQPPSGDTGTGLGGPGFGSPSAPSAGHGGPQAPPAWTPPPKPGLIPFRPLTLGDILGASFRVLRRNPRPTFGSALIVQGVIAVVTAAIVGFVTFTVVDRLVTASVEDAEQIAIGGVAAALIATLVPVLLASLAVALIQGIIVLEVQRAALGEKQTFRRLWAQTRGRRGALVGWAFILTAAITVAAVLLIVIIVLAGTQGTVGIILAVMIGIFGGLAFLVLGAWLGTRLSLVPSVLMAERCTLREAITRSWSLTLRYFWRTLGIQLLVAVILSVVTQVVYTPFAFLGPLIIVLVDPNGTGGPASVAVVIGTYVLSLLVAVVFSAIALVVQSATTSLIYIDLRMRKEGLDIELARHVEEAQRGQTDLANPYLITRT